MLLGRTAELKYLQNYYDKEGSQLVILYGRKNVGKTELIKEFCKDKSFTYYLAKPCSEQEQVYLWSAELMEEPTNLKPVEQRFDSIFNAITELKSPKKVIVIDEFQHIVKHSETFMNEVVKLIHNKWNNQPVMIVMCSSAIGWVENSMVSKMGENAYEITGLLKINELQFLDLVRRFPKYSMEQCVEAYAILGGIPGLWKYWDDTISVQENIQRNILQSGTYLNEEGSRNVAEELRETNVYHTILATLAAGKHKLNELHNHTGYNRAKISVYLKNLMELEIVEKVFSHDTADKENAQKGIYRISNHYVHFWFRFIFPHMSKMFIHSPEEYYHRYIGSALKAYTAPYFTKVCSEYMELMNRMNKLNFKYTRSGSWVGKVGTIDIVAQDEENHTMVGMCNWERNLMTYDDYEWLLFCVEKAKLKVDYFYLFTVGGFDEKLTLEAKVKKNIILIDISQL
jgi:uncharacterized protein